MNQVAQARLRMFILVAIVCAVVFATYSAIKDIAGQQSQQHQQSISPVFALIEKELLQPLHTAEVIANIGLLQPFFESDSPNEEELMALLSSFNEKFGHEFYLAHEKSRKQYNSNGRVFDLVEGEVVWYFALRDEFDSEVQAVLGKREDVHLYIDVRQYDAYGEFRGFAGVGKSLSEFLVSFNAFREQYGHEFIFVNNRDQIVLSSIPELSPTQAQNEQASIGIKTFSDLNWYNDFVERAQDINDPSVVIEDDNRDLLISRLQLQSLNWSLYIVTPLNVRQEEVNRSFSLYIGVGLFLILIIYKVLYFILDKYIDKVHSRVNKDELTGLANRKYGRKYFKRMRKSYREMSVIMCDLDDFKNINDSYGHAAGDDVLRKVAETFLVLTGSKDLVVRWGGEEFIIILTDKTPEEAEQFANLARQAVASIIVTLDKSHLSITGSFGVYTSRQLNESLDAMIELADQAMYEAKSAGKNKVVVANI